MTATEYWRAAHAQSADQLPRQTSDCAEEAFWQVHAPGYEETSPLAACAHEMIRDVRALLGPGWHLLEIGAGTGAFTRRLVTGMCCVTIAEPSASMRAEFERQWDGAGIVETLPCKWEDAPRLRADIVFGANAFYRMSDIATAISKMDRSATHRVVLVQTVGRPHANPLCVTVEGVPYERERADVLCDVLKELGIDHRRRDYDIPRPDGPSCAALIDWAPARTQIPTF